MFDTKIFDYRASDFDEYLKKNAEIITEDWLDALFVWRENSPDSVKSATKTKAECEALKAACLAVAAAADGAFVSTNDAVCAELAASIAPEGVDHLPVGLLMDYRAHVGGEGYVLGNLWCTLELLVRSSPAGAVDIREALPIAQSGEFVRWLCGQGANPAWPGKLMMNSWSKAFRLAEIAFEGAAADVMLGAPMLEQRLAMMAPAGVSYVITLPQADGGIKAVGVLPADAAQKLGARTV